MCIMWVGVLCYAASLHLLTVCVLDICAIVSFDIAVQQCSPVATKIEPGAF